MTKIRRITVFALLLCVLLSAGCTESMADNSITGSTIPAEQQYRTVVDSRGVAVQVPVNIEKVATISDGLVEGVMTAIGCRILL
jgi:iron complex transport system substrate-binding protein